MNWFEVDVEVDFFGKVTELIQAENKDDCEMIILHLISKSLIALAKL